LKARLVAPTDYSYTFGQYISRPMIDIVQRCNSDYGYYWLLEHCKKIDNDMGPIGPTAQSNVTVKKLGIISLRNKIIGCFSRTLQEG